MSTPRNAIVVAILILSTAVLSEPLIAIEKPQFELVDEVGRLEVRKYQGNIVARTLVTGSFEDAGNMGFKRLAGYIFGDNEQDQKMAMTSPVELEPGAETSPDTQYWVTFNMPREYSRDELPLPNDSRIQIYEVPEKTLAVLQYKGNWSEERYREHETLLLSLISENSTWEKQGKPSWSRYNPPFVPWFMRTNEVAIEVIPASGARP